MLVCEKCANSFPASKTINGKLRCLKHRKLCLDCKPYIERRTGKSMTIVCCRNCNKEFHKMNCEIRIHPNHFCSRSCSSTFNNRGKQKNKPKIRVCSRCTNTYTCTKDHGSHIICKPCAAKIGSKYIKGLTIKEYHDRPALKDKHPSWDNAHIRTLNRSWNQDLKKSPCIICGYSKHIELAHIRDVSDFPDSATLGEINHPNNNLPLCRNHHWEFDNNMLYEEDYNKIKSWCSLKNSNLQPQA